MKSGFNWLQNKIVVSALVLALYSCSSTPSVENCPQSPRGGVSDPTSLDLENKVIQRTGTIKSGQDIGFTFSGKKGQTLKYQSTGDICIWVYAPDNSLLVDDQLLTDGKYTLHIASKKNASDYEIEIEFVNTNTTVSSSPNNSVHSSQFNNEELTILQVIEDYFNARPQIFASPFDRTLADKYLTGERHRVTLYWMDWLQSKNAYYTYDMVRIDDIRDFSVKNNRATLYMTITQDFTMYVNGKIDSNPEYTTGKPRSDNYYYSLEKIKGVWKISEVEQ